MLYPKMTSSRMVFDLSGVWEFKLLDEEGTEREAAGNRLRAVYRCQFRLHITIYIQEKILRIM